MTIYLAPEDVAKLNDLYRKQLLENYKGSMNSIIVEALREYYEQKKEREHGDWIRSEGKSSRRP